MSKGLKKLNKMLLGRPRQVDFPAGQVSFYSHLPNGGGIREVIWKLNEKLTRTCSGQAQFKSYLSEGQAGFHFLFRPVSLSFLLLTLSFQLL